MQIFNLSVDAPDAQPRHVQEDLTINDMESIVEIILEKIFVIDDAIPEHDDADDENGSLRLKKSADFNYFNQAPKTEFSINSQKGIKHPFYADNCYQQFLPALISPPPEV